MLIPDGFEPYVLLDEANARFAARRWLLWSVYGGEGADKLSERAQVVTENRNRDSIKQGWGHSSCGDEEWFVQVMLGNHDHCVNRASLKGKDGHPGYRYSGPPNNLSLVQDHPDFVGGPITTQLGTGDGLLMDPGNMHIAVVLDHDPATKRLVVCQYGGTMGKVGTDGRLSEYPSDWHKDDLGREVRGVEFDGVYVRAEVKTKSGIVKKARKVIGHLPLWKSLMTAKKNGRLESLIYIPKETA